MGLEKIIGFLNKNLSYNGIKEISVENSCNKTIAENIFFDFNFIIYQNILGLEEDINNLQKIIYSLPYTEIDIIENEIEKLLSYQYLEIFREDILKIIDGDNNIIIIENLNKFINSEENFNKYIVKIFGKEFKSSNTIIDLMLFLRIFFYIDKIVNNIHHIEFVKNIFLFFDGIPSYSKILEQKRRRTKNYLESKIRKELFQEIFDNFKNDLYEDGNITYNYFDWLNNKISLDKSFGPSSQLILDLELFLKMYAKDNILKKVDYNLNICSGKVMGESDFKIFKYIQKKKIKDNIFIHTCDSDLVHLILVQQIYNFIHQKKINYHIIRYFSRDNSIVQHIESYFIVKELMKIIKKICDTSDSHYYILLDFLGLCYLFGNDHIPSNDWFGSELSFEEILYMLKETYNNMEGYILSYDKDKKIKFNWEMFLKFMKILDNKNISFKVNMIRNHRTYDGIFTFINKTNLSYNEFIIDYIPKYLSFKGSIKENEETDKLYYWDSYFFDKLKFDKNPFDNIIDSSKMTKFCDLLDEWLNNFRDEDKLNYLPKYERTQELEENEYQNLYQYISSEANKIGNIKYEIFFKNNIVKPDNVDDNIIYMYLKMFYYMINNFFIDMSEYNSINLVNYNRNYSPSLTEIINFLNKQNLNELSSKMNKDISKDFISEKLYFNKLSHHLFITPYLYKSVYLEKIDNIANIDKILIKLNEIDNFCIDSDNYNYNFKEIEPITFLKKWQEITNKINLS